MIDLKKYRNTVYYYLYGIDSAQYWTLLLYGLALLSAIASSFILKNPFWQSFLEPLVFFTVGIQGIWAAIGYLVYPQQTATLMGWQRSGYQTEAGAAHLGLGIAGLLSVAKSAWTVPIACIALIMLVGALYAHIAGRRGQNDWFARAQGIKRGGPMLYASLATAVSLFLALIFGH